MRREIVIGVMGITAGFVLGFLGHKALSNRAATAPAATAQQMGDAPSTPGAPVSGQVPTAHPPADVVNQIKELKKTAEREPQNIDVRALLANQYFDMGLYADAIQYYTEALALAPNNVSFRTDRATAYHYMGQHETAMTDLRKSLEIDPAHPQTMFNLGVVRLQGFNDPKGAIEAWENFVRVNPSNPAIPKVKEQIAKLREELAKKPGAKL